MVRQFGLVLIALVLAVAVAWAEPKQDSEEVSVSQTLTTHTFTDKNGNTFVAQDICFQSLSTSTNTCYFKLDGADATADPDDSEPLAPGKIKCFGAHRTRKVSMICDTGETATWQLLGVAD